MAQRVEREFASGMTVKCWGCNGLTPGPTIEAVKGDRVRLHVRNQLPEHTTIHWHGIRDGRGGLTQPGIKEVRGPPNPPERSTRSHATS